MHMKYGKVKFGFKDTFDLRGVLRPVIAEALIKFKEVVEFHEYRHNPNTFIEDMLGSEIEYKSNEEGFIVRNIDEELMEELWWECVDKMIFAFTAKEPCIEDYDFSMDIITVEDAGKRASRFVCTNEEEYDRHTTDVMDYQTKVQEGYELFGKYLQDLWW